jgi:putative ABC transport system permease protein
MEMVSGRGFSPEFSADQREGFVINEELANLMGENTTAGATFATEGRTGQVIGIVKDFHFQPATNEIGPMALYMLDGTFPISSMLVRISPGDVAGSLQYLADTWAEVLPEYPLEYSFLSERIEAVYWQTSQLSTLATSFSVLAMLLAGLGMFGMASFTASRRARELAIRKVFGGSTLDVGLLLWREYAGCLLLACLIAGPLAYYCMHRWLQDFVFRVPVEVGSYLVAAVLVAGVTLLAVSWQTLAISHRSPAVTLK